MDELKSCPFCGGEAETHEIIDGWIVSCSSDQNVLDGFTHMAHAYGGTEAKAIAEWNTRAERTCMFVSSRGPDYPPSCSACGYELDLYECLWFEGGTYGYAGNYCPNCGAKVVDE